MPDTSLSILDVGHGNSAVLIDVGKTVVIDAGPGTALLEFLTEEEIRKVDVLLISHADRDHIEGVISLIESENVAIDLVRLNTDSMKGSKLWDDLIYELDQANKAGNLQFEIGLSSNDTGKFSTESVHIEIVAPSPYLAAKGPGSSDRGGRHLTSNTVSAVIRLVRRGKPVALIPGDIDHIGLEYLSSSGFEAAAPIAVFPHHGGKPGKGDMTEFAHKFCEIVEPENVIFSTGRARYNTPRSEIIAAVCKKCPKVRFLCTQLSEHCASLLPEEQPSHLSGKFSRGLEYNRCCAGTIFIPLDNSTLTLFPLPEDHLEFIRKAAPTALCMRPFQSQNRCREKE